MSLEILLPISLINIWVQCQFASSSPKKYLTWSLWPSYHRTHGNTTKSLVPLSDESLSMTELHNQSSDPRLGYFSNVVHVIDFYQVRFISRGAPATGELRSEAPFPRPYDLSSRYQGIILDVKLKCDPIQWTNRNSCRMTCCCVNL